MTADPNVTLAPMTPHDVDKIEPSVYRVRDDGSIDDQTWRKTIVAPPNGNAMFYVRIAPNGATPRHSHPSDTVYIVRRGQLVVPGEGVYNEGEVRWVKANTVYGPEAAGPDGCEFYYVSMGPFGSDPEV